MKLLVGTPTEFNLHLFLTRTFCNYNVDLFFIFFFKLVLMNFNGGKNQFKCKVHFFFHLRYLV